MLRFITIAIMLTTCPLLTACFFVNDNESAKITGLYNVMWIDVPEQQVIGENDAQGSNGSTTVIDEYIFAVGHNDRFIIAKQHPTEGFEKNFKIDPSVTHYYILDMTLKTNPDKHGVQGPLTLKQFNKMRKQLHIEKIEFDMIYPDVP